MPFKQQENVTVCIRTVTLWIRISTVQVRYKIHSSITQTGLYDLEMLPCKWELFTLWIGNVSVCKKPESNKRKVDPESLFWLAFNSVCITFFIHIEWRESWGSPRGVDSFRTTEEAVGCKRRLLKVPHGQWQGNRERCPRLGRNVC